MEVDKEALRRALLALLRADLEALIRTQTDAQEGATHGESRAEHAKDTRATEQSYLARGLAERVETLREAEARLTALPLAGFDDETPIAAGALVSLLDTESGALQHWWLLPMAGGRSIEHDGETIRTITPGTPLGGALLGRVAGESGTLRTPRGERDFEIVAAR